MSHVARVLSAGLRTGARIAVAGVFMAALVVPSTALAFKPGGHQALLESVVASLPAGDPFRKAYESSDEAKKIAALGACGPDLPFEQLGSALDYAPWAVALHNSRGGTVAKTLVKSAVDSGDPKRMAFALGYVTHMAGDAYSVGIFTKPEAGVGFNQMRSNSAQRLKIDNLESAAEAYIWKAPNLGKHPDLSQYTNLTFPNRFPTSFQDIDLSAAMRTTYAVPNVPDPSTLARFNLSALKQSPLATIIAQSQLGILPSDVANSIASTLSSIFTQLGLGSWFTNSPAMKLYQDTSASLTSVQKGRIDQAYDLAKKRSIGLLTNAEQGDYHGMSDCLAADAGIDKSAETSSPAIIVRVKTGSLENYMGDVLARHLDGVGTDDDVWIRFMMSDGTVVERQLGLGRSSDARNKLRNPTAWGIPLPIPALPLNLGDFEDMESGRVDEYPIDLTNVKLESITSLGLRKAAGDGANGKWRPEWIQLLVNGQPLPSVPVSSWLGEPITVQGPNPKWPWEGPFTLTYTIVNGSLTYEYSVSALWSGSRGQLAKPAAPLNLSASATPSGVQLSWPAPTSPKRVRILRSAVNYATSAIDSINQELVYEGSAASVIDTDVTYPKQYYFTAFYGTTFDVWSTGRGRAFFNPSPPPAPCSYLVVTPGNGANMLSWTNPTDRVFDHAVVVRKQGSYPTSLSDGVQVTKMSPVSATDSGLVNGTTYCYSVYAVNDADLAATPAQASGTPDPGLDDFAAPGPVTGFSCSGTSEHTAVLTWANPADADFSMVRILRSPFGYATSPNPGTNYDRFGIPKTLGTDNQWLAYQGPGTTFTDDGLVLTLDEVDLSGFSQEVQDQIVASFPAYGVKYYYTAYARDKFGRWSVRALTTATTRDATPPRTTLSGVASSRMESPILGWNSRWTALFYPWVNHDVRIELNATDDVSGVNRIMYQLPAQSPVEYTAPLDFTNQGGPQSIEFWSFDNAGNLDGSSQLIRVGDFPPYTYTRIYHGETVRWGIDKTPPTSSSDASPSHTGSAKVTFTSADSVTYVSCIRYRLDGASGETTPGGSVTATKAGNHQLIWWAVDRVGNEEPAHEASFTVRNVAAISLRASQPTTIYGSLLTLRALLVSPGAADTSSRTVTFERRLANGTWASVGSAMTRVGGGASRIVKPVEKTTYRVRFSGDSLLTPATSGLMTAYVQARLTKPVAPTRASRTKRILVYGYITPVHPSGATTYVKCYKYSSGRWVYKKQIATYMSAATGGRSKYWRKVLLSSAGKWRLVVTHSDAAHVRSYSPYSSTITVR